MHSIKSSLILDKANFAPSCCFVIQKQDVIPLAKIIVNNKEVISLTFARILLKNLFSMDHFNSLTGRTDWKLSCKIQELPLCLI